MTKTYWTYENHDYEFDTFAEAYEHAEEHQADTCMADGVKSLKEDYEFSEFVADDDAEHGKKTINTKIAEVEYDDDEYQRSVDASKVARDALDKLK